MLDFVSIEEETTRNGSNVYPEFIVNLSTKDLMIRGKTFYAVWDEDRGFWSRNEKDVQRMTDRMIFDYVEDHPSNYPRKLKLMSKFSTNKWKEWQQYCKSLPDNFHELDSKIVFSNSDISRNDYMTRTLSYPLQEGPIDAYNELMDTLYSPEERRKLEWAIGSIIFGDSKKLQKFIVLYGGPGTGKSTVLNIIERLFDGYCSVFDSKALSSANSTFALEAFRDNPLICIQHDGDLSKIEDNTKLNSIVSHEAIVINEKFKATYSSKIQSFLFMGTNKPVRITDAKSGILRRLIDVTPTGNKVPRDRYEQLLHNISFEFPGIAWHCLQVYQQLGYKYYDNYIPEHMMGITNDFYNFIEDNYDFFSKDDDGITLKTAWMRYKDYCEDARVPFPLSMRLFKHELENYFDEVHPRYPDGRRSVYTGFQRDKFQSGEMMEEEVEVADLPDWLKLDYYDSELDDILKDCPAQYANADGVPEKSWDKVKTTLKDLNTGRVHYVRPPEQLIVIDLDLKNEKGEKDAQRNLEEASKFPQTYTEYSQGGKGIHLHYYYDGDISALSRLVRPDVEIKVFTGKGALRRKLGKCNRNPIARISSGLPLKEVKPMLQGEIVHNEKSLRKLVIRNLRKEIHPNTKPSIDFIRKILDDAYNDGVCYDLEDLRPDVQAFALGSTNQADYCLRMVSLMHFKSEEPSECVDDSREDQPIIFFDVEVFPNLFVIVWKKQGEGCQFNRLINPKPEEVEELFSYRLVGFNNRNYDNHILYAAAMGYTNEQLFDLSRRIIANEKDAKFGEAYNLSYTDIYDFLSASNKMSLKKWEIKLGIHHQELGLPWDQPVDKKLWKKVADYCENDVFATEATWDANQADWRARQILAKWAKMTVNDTTNSLTTRLIVGKDKNPQEKFLYTDLSTIFPGYEYNPYGFPKEKYKEGVKIVRGKSFYKGKDPGEGGYAIGYPGIYWQTAVLDVKSMHPHSAIRLKIFGEEYTMRFEDIVEGRVAIKEGRFEDAKKRLPEDLWVYLGDSSDCEALADALKTAINSVYGLTSASFPNKLRDPRNIDNIVAKYGALFMINLEEEVTNRGYQVVHIKTDSIKIANADPEIIAFCMDYAKKYGFEFEHEATYDRICLVNDAVFIAKYASEEFCQNRYGYIPGKNRKKAEKWTATGTQFQIPYVFKTLFSKEPIEFGDLCETKTVTSAMYLDFNEGFASEEEHDYRFVGKVGLFCPVKPGYGGGILLREGQNGKFAAVTGTKKKKKGEVYRWMESEMAKTLDMDAIDLSYYQNLVDAAVDEISKYGNFDHFVNGVEYEWMEIPFDEDDEVPFPMNRPEKAA